MARESTITHIKTTKANLDTQASANNLLAGELYCITDQGGRTAIGTGVNSYVMTAPRGVYGFAAGIPEANEVLAVMDAPYAFNITQANCSVKAIAAATGSTILTIKNGGSNIGTATFAAAGTTATVAITTPAVALGNLISLVAPASPDATLAGISFRLME